ncbi:hypothetical protein [Phocaeicola dorei]|uniref:hypothetical protein n=1 Tax=Phocaeicola dorei TaxID=357276 RepID=UPI0022E6C063|nr:hypothetical protein [Phocaeicola dorei]
MISKKIDKSINIAPNKGALIDECFILLDKLENSEMLYGNIKLRENIIKVVSDLLITLNEGFKKFEESILALLYSHILELYDIVDTNLDLSQDVEQKILYIQNSIKIIIDTRFVVPLNSEKYYKDQINELQRKIEQLQKSKKSYLELEKELSLLVEEKDRIKLQMKKKDQDSTLKEYENIGLRKKNEELSQKIKDLKTEIEKHKKETRKNELLQAELDRYKEQVEQSIKQKDAINEWKNKITEAFKGLDEPLNNMKKEHIRLASLYKIYKYSSMGLVIILLAIELIIYWKISTIGEYPSWEQYWLMVIPIPVILGLLWGFITQMNRAQRLMVLLAKQIHEVKYTEGLLQALNTLSTDINESMQKINQAISRLIDNHLRNLDSLHVEEDDLIRIDKKDCLPYEKVLASLKDIKALIQK